MKVFPQKVILFSLSLFIFLFLILPTQKDIVHALVCIASTDATCRDLSADDIIDQNTRCLPAEILVKGSCLEFAQGNLARENISSDYGCVNGRGDCYVTVQSLNFQNTTELCEDRGNYLNIFVIKRKCPDVIINNPRQGPPSTVKRGCIKSDGFCEDVEAPDGVDFLKRLNDKCVNTYGKEARLQVSECGPDRDYPCYFSDTGACTTVKANTPESAQGLCMALCKAEDKARCYVNLDFNEKCQAERAGPLAGTSLEELQKTAAKQLNKAQASDPRVFISRAINLMTAFIGSIALLLYVVSGFLWMTASGASEQVDKAKKIMVWTTLGVIVMLFSYILTSTLFDLIPK